MAKTITVSNNEYIGIPRIDFLNPDFSALVEQKGADVIWERAIPCPCGKRLINESCCRNCQGTGWVFINPHQIKAIVSSINKDTKYKEWSVELLGTVSLTVRPEFQLNYMDKISILGSDSLQSENLKVKYYGGKMYINTIYPVNSVIEIFKFVTEKEPLLLINTDEYSIENNFIVFNLGINIKEGDSITVTYRHNITYHILDLPHDVRNSIILNELSRESLLKLPISAIGRRAHNVIDAVDFDGTGVFDNSYIK